MTGSTESGQRVIGVDLGGTKTHVAFAAAAGSSGGRRDVVVPSTWRAPLGDFAADAEGLHDLLVAHGGDSVVDASVVVGAHGCDSTAQCLALETELRTRFRGPVRVVNDSELMGPAMGAVAAIGVVVGTGSIATARNATGELLTAGGWGWLLGDEGSAAGLVRDATRAVLARFDDDDPLEPLGRRLLDAFHAQDRAELALAVSSAESAENWGRHAPEVFAAADEGSPLAQALIDRAGADLARLVSQLRTRGTTSDTVVAGGTVIQRQPRLQQSLRSALAETAPAVTLHILDQAPIDGAIVLASDLHASSTPSR
ncbi:BadF/BadG/BcrA/BcrD ATPase family protein [Microbacterium azadirachtae]|uniref:BadF/BadG/BcrA/BcrD ATPase family protein n=1 Tax=Microbacterium azadirachtae TaxID=582680 RepID=UPI003F74F02C